jgi:phage gpG-like protein
LSNMIHLTGTVLGDVQLDRVLTRIISASKDLSKPFEEGGEEFRDIEKERFDAEGFDWPPLAPGTVARKKRLYGDKPILRATDALYESLTIKGAAGNVSRVFPLMAEFGTNIFYAIFHQTGTSRMPAREVILFREEDKHRFVRAIQRYMIATGQSAGFQIIAE